MRYAVAALADEEAERYLVVTTSAELAFQYFFHTDRVTPGFGQEDVRMAIAACEPARVRDVGKTHMGHLLRILHDDIHVQLDQRFTLSRRAVQALARRDEIAVQRLHPVHFAAPILGGNPPGIPQDFEARVTRDLTDRVRRLPPKA